MQAIAAQRVTPTGRCGYVAPYGRLTTSQANVDRNRAIGFPRLEAGVQRFDLHLAVSLSWLGFIRTMVLAWLVINLSFATLYAISPGDVANAMPGSFSDVFFFSVETLATVGYGVMAPTTSSTIPTHCA
jgi:hypothetical protein